MSEKERGRSSCSLSRSIVSADLIDMLGSASGHRYVLVIIDHFTVWASKALLTDNGAEFVNVLFRNVCRILQVKTMYATAYHPQANGMVDRSNLVIKYSLATLVDQHPNDWNDLLQ